MKCNFATVPRCRSQAVHRIFAEGVVIACVCQRHWAEVLRDHQLYSVRSERIDQRKRRR